MKNNHNIPGEVRETFPIVLDATFIRRLASSVPLIPDTTFDIYAKGTEDFIALVTTDHADPKYQSQELKDISGQDGFEFTHLIKPHDNSGKTIEVLDNDDMEGNFFVVVSNKKHQLYYYMANLKLDSNFK